MSPRRLHVTRYVAPLREGGSMPAVVEADDDGLYVLKFRGAGQGPKALVAEWIAGNLARVLGFEIPELAIAELDPLLARTEGDPEIQHLIQHSGGLNFAMDYLPGAINFDPLAWEPDPLLASRIVWFDAFICNVDRSTRNPNMMTWHRKLYLIDHGASLYFHHGWDGRLDGAGDPFPLVRDHVLLPWADRLDEADAALAPLLDRATIEGVVAGLPGDWLDGPQAFAPADTQREAYVAWLLRRLSAREAFVEEARRART